MIANEFGMKRSFLSKLGEGADANEANVRSARAIVKMNLRLHEQRVPVRVDSILSASMKLASPYSESLKTTVSDMAEYLPSDLVVFKEDDVGPSTFDSDLISDTSTLPVPLTHKMLLVDAVTAHRPSRLAAVARLLRSSCQEVWAMGVALHKLFDAADAKMSSSFKEVVDQDSPVAILTADAAAAAAADAESDTTETDGGDTETSTHSTDELQDSVASVGLGGAGLSGLGGTSGLSSTSLKAPGSGSQRGKLMSVFRPRSGSTGSKNDSGQDSGSSPSSPAGGNNSKPNLLSPTPAKSASTASLRAKRGVRSFTMRGARKKRTCVDYGADEALLWLPSLVLPQVLGLLHGMTVLRQTLKHARLENRIVLETADVDSVLANCVYEFSRLLKTGGSQLLAMAVADPTNTEVGALGLALANACVLLTRSTLTLMNVDRQVLRAADRAASRGAAHRNNDSSDGPPSAGPSVATLHPPAVLTPSRSSAGTPKTRRKKKRAPATPTLSGNPLQGSPSPRHKDGDVGEDDITPDASE